MARIAARYAERLVTHAATLRWLTRLRTRMFADAASSAPGRLAWLRSGEALERAMRDADTVDEVLLRSLVPVGVAALGAAGAAAVFWQLSPPVAASFLIGAICTAAVALGAGAVVPPVSAARGAARAELVAAVDAWPELASLGAARRLREATLARFEALEAVEARAGRRASWTSVVVDCAAGSTVAVVLAACLLGTPRLGLADTALVALLAGGVVELVTALASASRWLRHAAVSARRLAVAPEIPKPIETGDGFGPGGLWVNLRGYPVEGTDARLDMSVAPGAALVLNGRSGSGKTTLLRTLAGEEPAPPGTVTVGGTAPARSHAGRILFVDHEDYLFTGTVADNLRLADPALSDTQVEELLGAMCLTGSGIGAATRLGVGGRPVSGGEQRRLCLARAIAARPRLLLLDEPTEAIDEPTARAVLAVVRDRLPAATIVAAIHDTQLGAVPWPNAVRLSMRHFPAASRIGEG